MTDLERLNELQAEYESLIDQLARYEVELENAKASGGTSAGSRKDEEALTHLRTLLTETRAERDSLRQQLAGKVESLETAGRVIEEMNRKIAEASAKGGVLEIRITSPNGDTRSLKGVFHASFKRLLQLASARMNILLVGPAGSGKTHVCAQLAEALGLPFGFVSCSAGMSEGQLTGRLVPTGKAGRFEYLRSEFVRSYEEGGVFLFDEVDAADSNTLLVINSALANGHTAVSNRPENPVAKKHADFVCVAAANTFGTGADRQYVGRNQLDESTLDRFRIGQVELDYSPEVEEQLCPDDELRTRLQGIRAKIRQSKLRRIVSTRFLRDAYRMKQAGWTDAEIESALMAGWTPDEVAKVRGTF